MRTNLRVERVKKNLTQKELAKALGLSQATYSLYELGKASPSLENAEKIANFFGKDISYIFSKNDTRENSLVEESKKNKKQ